MKRKIFNILIILFSLIAVKSLAQEEPDLPAGDKKGQEKIRVLHIVYISERLGLTPEEAEKFWPVYREYAQKRKDLNQQFRNAKQSGQDEKTLLDLDLKIKQQKLDLEKDYSGRLQNIITPQKLMNLRQAERDFTQIVWKQIQQRQQHLERQQQLRERPERLQQRNN